MEPGFLHRFSIIPQGGVTFPLHRLLLKALRAAPALRPSAQRAPQRPPDPLVGKVLGGGGSPPYTP